MVRREIIRTRGPGFASCLTTAVLALSIAAAAAAQTTVVTVTTGSTGSTTAGQGQTYDWPHFRGSNFDGSSPETGLGAEGLDKAKAWEANVGAGLSAVVVAGGSAFTMGNSGDKDTVYCLDAETGKSKWTYSYGCATAPYSGYWPGGPIATPTVKDGKVYTMSKEGHVYCLDAQTGAVVWQYKASGKPSYGFGSSPLVIDDKVILNAGSRGVALSKDSGTEAAGWESSGGTAGWSSVIPYSVAGTQTTAVALVTRSGVVGRDPRTGNTLWSVNGTSDYAPEPVCCEGRLFLSHKGGSSIRDLSGGTPAGATQVNGLRSFYCISPPACWKGSIFAVGGDIRQSGPLVCIDAKTGAVQWQQNEAFGTVCTADDKVFFLTEKGTMIVVKAVPTGYEEITRCKILPGTCWSTPTISGRKLYARDTSGKLVCYNLGGVLHVAELAANPDVNMGY